jgi:hypothetical protein
MHYYRRTMWPFCHNGDKRAPDLQQGREIAPGGNFTDHVRDEPIACAGPGFRQQLPSRTGQQENPEALGIKMLHCIERVALRAPQLHFSDDVDNSNWLFDHKNPKEQITPVMHYTKGC